MSAVKVEDWEQGEFDKDSPVELRHWACAKINGVNVTLWFPAAEGDRSRQAFKKALGLGPTKVRDLPIYGGNHPCRDSVTRKAIVGGRETELVIVWSDPAVLGVLRELDDEV